MQVFAGIPAAPGIAIGPGHHHRPERAEPRRYTIADPAAEIARLDAAVAAAAEELAAVHTAARADVGDEAAAIFEAQRMMLLDPDLLEMAGVLIRAEQVNAEAAFFSAAEGYAKALEGLTDEYLRARAADVRDVARRVIRVLSGAAGAAAAAALPGPAIVFAEDLAPSDTVRFERGKLLGFFTAQGGATSHTAILARALGIPAVVGAGALPEGDGGEFILDGDGGRLLVDPDEAELARYRALQEAGRAQAAVDLAAAAGPAVTRDGVRVEVAANIGNLADAVLARANGADGVGLFRTEFAYLERGTTPTEDELVEEYRAIFEVFAGLPVVVRTLDIGGDKEAPQLGLPAESNPFLGLRGIRLCLARPDLFRPQLRAILRAGVGTDLRIMFPMISGVEELRAARAILDQCRVELERDGLAHHQAPQVGAMIEVPAAALCAGELAREVDFFSLGTNDLAQYVLAADRTNAAVATLADGAHPAVMRLVREVIEAGHAAGIWVGMCGELAGEAVEALLALGLDEFSVGPGRVAGVKARVRSWGEGDLVR